MSVLFPLKTQNSQGVRALNKPITLLWLLGHYRHKGNKVFTFQEVESGLSGIMNDYTGKPNIIDPFWRLRKDGILFFPDEDKIRTDNSGGASKVDLRKYGRAHFTKEFLSFISREDNFIHYLEAILEDYFPESYEEDILYITGLDYLENSNGYGSLRKKRKRDPKFRDAVGVAYNHQCAVCGFNLMLAGRSIANEAAHIKWHANNGPDTVSNGLLLCHLHHKLFDRGVFSFSDQYRLNVSDQVSSYSEGFKKWLLDYENHEIILPRRDEWIPDRKYLEWHRKNVFKA